MQINPTTSPNLTPEQGNALAFAVLCAAAGAAASALVTWGLAEAQRRLEGRPCPKCAERQEASK